MRSPVRVRLTPAVRDAKGWRSIDFTAPPLAAGESIAFSYLIENAEHDFEIVLEADVDNSVDESDESDNRVVAHYSNPPPDVDRWVSMGPERMTDIEDLGYGWDDASGRLSTLVIDPHRPGDDVRRSSKQRCVEDGRRRPVVAAGVRRRDAQRRGPGDRPVAAVAPLPGHPHDRRVSVGRLRTSWTQISTANLLAVVHAGAFVIHPANPTRLFVASDSGVQRSTDSGATWALSLSGGLATALVADPASAGPSLRRDPS